MAVLFESMTPNLIVIFTAFLIGLYLYAIRNFNLWKKLGVPYVKPTPFLGNLKELVFQQRSIGEHLKEIYDEHRGLPYVGIFSFDQPSLVIRDLDLVKNILVKDARNFIDRVIAFDEHMDPLFGRSMFTLKGQRWRNVRKNLNSVFTSGKMRKMFYLVDNCGKELANYLDRATTDGSTVMVKEVMARFTTDVIASCGFGIESNSLRNPASEFRHHLKNVFSTTTARKRLSGLTGFFAPSIQYILRLYYLDDKTTNFIRDTVWSTVEHREKHGSDRKDFLDSMIELRKKGKEAVTDKTSSRSDTNFKIDGDLFVAQAFAFLTAGFETSATSLSFALYELALHPDCQHRLRAEITQVLSKHQGEVTYDGLQEMSYLDMVVSETLRKYPVLPFLDRRCVSDYKLPGPSGEGTVTLPAGTGVYISVTAFQNDPKYHPEPEKFDPERFTEEEKQKRPNYTYFPFGEGPRICIGMMFGLIQVKTGLIHILSRYEVAPTKDTPENLEFDPKPFLMLTVGEIPLSFKKNRSDVTSG